MAGKRKNILRRAKMFLSFLLEIRQKEVYRMLTELGFPQRRALLYSMVSTDRSATLLKESGLRLMLYRKLRDPFDICSERYFGRNLLRNPVECIVDIGAYKGSWSRSCSELLRPKTVHMFEPNPDAVADLADSFVSSECTNYVLHNKAVGDSAKEVCLNMYSVPMFNSVLEFSSQNRKVSDVFRKPFRDSVKVSQVRLDDELGDVPVVDFMKIDTQGYEMEVLDGAANTLARTKLVMIEANFLLMYQNGSTIADVHKRLLESGFLLVQMDAPSRSRGVCVWTDALYVSERVI